MSDDFEPHREFLMGVAYRMLGSFAEAEDIVQDAFLRWSAADRGVVEQPRAFLARIVSRLCLDRMKSAAARREQYVGFWLPEPMVSPAADPLAYDLSLALLLTLERLSPLERAAFLLHDVFDMDYAAIAETVGSSEAACRQLAARAREHVREERPRFSASEESRDKLADAFQVAIVAGDLAAIAKLLADDAIFYSDGGGKRRAALKPIYGKDRILRFFVGIARKSTPVERLERVQINGLPGFLVRSASGVETLAFDIANDQIVAIYAVRNPDKLRHLS
ncbi:MAG: sigma-70 family RNA polymerase sigma factor [Kofleriaceae bacterium]